MMRRFFVMVAVVALAGATLPVGAAVAATETVSCQVSGRGKFYLRLTSTPGTVRFSLKLTSSTCTGLGKRGRVKLEVRNVTLDQTDCSSTSLGALPARARWHTRHPRLNDSKISFLTSRVGPGFSTLTLGVNKATDSTIDAWSPTRTPGGFSGGTAQVNLVIQSSPRHVCPTDFKRFSASGILTI
jgi:hypothetical protein